MNAVSWILLVALMISLYLMMTLRARLDDLGARVPARPPLEPGRIVQFADDKDDMVVTLISRELGTTTVQMQDRQSYGREHRLGSSSWH